jgi:hypothetical protein
MDASEENEASETDAEKTESESAETDTESLAVGLAETETEDTETETEIETDTEPAETETVETATESAETETEAESEDPTEASTESTTAVEVSDLTDGPESQFELASTLLPECTTIGIIFSSDNETADEQIQTYETLAEAYGWTIQTAELAAEEDIDFEASLLVGEVDAIFCIEDDLVDQLLQTVRAYADEVEIPVFAVKVSQVEQGAVAAFVDGTLHWNQEEAQKLELTAPDGVSIELE